MASYNLKVEKRTSYQRSIPSITVHPDDEQVSVIRKEFVLLTGDHFSAVVLNQLLYWTLRVKDFDLYLEEEKVFGSNVQDHPIHPESSESSQYGWIYKTATDLSEETLLGISKTTMRKYLKVLIDQGWVEERANTIEKWKKTTQYRVNIRKLHTDLISIGRQLPGVYLKAFSAALGIKQPHKHLRTVSSNDDATSLKNQLKSEEKSKTKNLSSESKILPSKIKILSSETEILPSKTKILPSKTENLSSESKILSPKTEILPSYTYTEITTKNTNREHTARAREIKNVLEEEKIEDAESTSSPSPLCAKASLTEAPHAEAMVEIWEKHVASSPHLTQKRKKKLLFVLNAHFQNDIGKWNLFCERLKFSPFLMGEGPRGWRVTLDWILVEENLLKVLEGNFDDPAVKEHALAKEAKQSHAEKTKEILTSIEDPVWREWCTQFSEGIRLNETLYRVEPLSLYDLEGIANARLLELEGEKLLWVGSSDSSVLNKIEDLRLTLSSYFTRTYPKFRTIRTRLIESSSESQSIPMIQAGGPPLGETLSSEQTHHNFTKSQQKGLNHA